MRHLAIAGLFGVVLLIGLRIQSSDASSDPIPPLSIDAKFLDFGEVWSQQGLKWPVRIVNSSDREIVISEFQQSCRCTSIAPGTAVVPGHGHVDITLTLDLISPSTTLGSAERRRFASSFIAKVDGDSPQAMQWTIVGTVKPLVHFLDSPILQFSEDTDQELVPFHRFLPKGTRFEVAAPIAKGKVTVMPPNAGTATLSLESATAGIVEVVPTSSLDGHFKFSVKLQLWAKDGSELPPTALNVYGICRKEFYAEPSSVIIGPEVIGAAVESRVMIKSRGGRRFSVVGVQGTSNATHGAVGDGLGASTAAMLNVTQLIVERGMREESLEVRLRVGDSEEESTIAIPVKYVGIRRNGREKEL